MKEFKNLLKRFLLGRDLWQTYYFSTIGACANGMGVDLKEVGIWDRLDRSFASMDTYKTNEMILHCQVYLLEEEAV